MMVSGYVNQLFDYTLNGYRPIFFGLKGLMWVSFVGLVTNDCSETSIILQAYVLHISYPHCPSLLAKLAFV